MILDETCRKTMKMSEIKAMCGSITILIASVLMLAHTTAGQDNTTEPHLRFKKSIIVKPYRNGQAYTEPYTVKQGEHLWKILRDHYKMSNAKIAFYCTMTRTVNPDLQDINILQKDQNILVPYDYVKGTTKPQHDNATGKDIVHVITNGEYLGKILREKCRLSEEKLFSKKTRDLLASANPKIADLDMLEAGQTIKIPMSLCRCSEQQGIAVPLEQITGKAAADADTQTSHDKRQKPGSPAQAEELPVESLHNVFSAETGADVSPDESRVRNMLAAYARTFDGKDNLTGEKVFSIHGRGTMTFDYSKFPVYSFPWGKKVLFDYGNKLPAGMREAIASEWKNAEVVAVRSRDDMDTILGKVLDGSGFYRVERGGEYTASRDNIQISVSGNWIVFKDNMLKNVFVVNLIQGDEQSMPEGIKEYFAGTGLSVVDIHKDSPAAVKKKSGYAAQTRFRQIPSDPIIIADMILDLIGQKYQKDYNTKIFQNMYSGFSLEVVADRMFEKDYETYLIDFHNLPGRIAGIIHDQGFHLLQISPRENDLDLVIKKVLAFCGASFKPSPVKFRYDHGEKTNVKLTIPGYLIETGTGDVLLTQTKLRESIIKFLSDIDIKIINY